MSERMEFGCRRTSCACTGCITNCQFMPGFLIPADLDRMMPLGINRTEPPSMALNPAIAQWAEENLLASPGALAMKDGETFRIPTLVPATKPDGSCKNLKDGLCTIHAVAPFGCAFFDCTPEVPGLNIMGISAVAEAHRTNALYSRIWVHLFERGLRQQRAEILRARMREALGL